MNGVSDIAALTTGEQQPADVEARSAPATSPRPAPRLTIGLFVTSTRPASPSQARLQQSIFQGLAALAGETFDFVALSFDEEAEDDLPFPHVTIRTRGRWAGLGRRLMAGAAEAARAAWRFTGASGGRTLAALERWSTVEPAHFRQLRELNVRLLWNVNQHALETPTPFVRTIWEANHRIHSMYPEYAYARYGFDGVDGGMAASLARASYVVTGTETGKGQIVRMLGVHESKVRVIPFPAPRLPPSSPYPPPTERFILYPARFWPHKNHVVILEALALLRVQGRDLRCVFTGADGGTLRHVMDYAERLGVRDLVDWRGQVSDAELAALYATAWSLVYASAVGPDNLPPLEAMTLGCPVITADAPGAREQYGEAALFFPPTDEQALVARLTELGDDGLRAGLIRRGSALASARTGKAYAAQMLSLLGEFAKVARAWERCDSPVW
jgi:glycosyltransferase involved in cell wall biosynthesis